jgi:ABC-type amino acid transport substrate-binding protein
MRKKLSLLVAVAMSLTVALTGAGAASAQEDTSKLNLIKPGSLVVGMTLQFVPQMYLNSRGKPAGYDYQVLRKLSQDLGLKLEIRNMAFAGLIPGLQAKQFDMISVGLGKTAIREQSMTYVGPYMPYQTLLVTQRNNRTAATVASWNVTGKRITALQGSLAAGRVKEMFPNATLAEYPTQDGSILEVVSGRADAVLMETPIFAGYNKRNPGVLKQLRLDQVIRDYYGEWTVQLGNTALQERLKDWLCDNQDNGFLARTFRREMGYKQPGLPAC